MERLHRVDVRLDFILAEREGVSFNVGESYLKNRTLRQGADVILRPIDRFRFTARPSFERNHRERNAVDINVFFSEESCLGVWRITHAAQPASNYLFTEQLTAKGSQPEDMRDVIRVPSFVEHRHGDDTPHLLTRLSFLPDCGDDAPQLLRGLRPIFARVGVFCLCQHSAINPQRP